MDVVHLEMEQGATFKVSLTYTDPDNVPVPLAPYRAHMQVRQRYGSPVLLDLTTENDGIVFDAAPGVIKIRGKASDTANVTRNCIYDLHLILIADPEEVIRVFGGTITLQKAVTVDVPT